MGLPTKKKADRERSRGLRADGWQTPGPLTGLRSVAFDALSRHLGSCTDPNEVGQALSDYLHHWFDRVLFMVVRGQELEGRLGAGLEETTDPRQVRISLSTPSTISHVVAARTPFLGTLPNQGQDGVLCAVLGPEGPMVLVPILIRSRVVALLCGGTRNRPLPERELGDVVVLAESKYEAILAARKKTRSPS